MGRIAKATPKSEYLKIRLKEELREKVDASRDLRMPDVQLQDFAAHLIRLGLEVLSRSSGSIDRAVDELARGQLLEPQRPAAGE